MSHKSLSWTRLSNETLLFLWARLEWSQLCCCYVRLCFWRGPCNCERAKVLVMQHFCDALVSDHHVISSCYLWFIHANIHVQMCIKRQKQDSLMFFLLYRFLRFYLQALTNIQYELFMVLFTVGASKRDTYIHVILFLKQSRKLGTTWHRCSYGYVWWFTEQLYSTLCDTEAMQCGSFYFFTSWITSSSSITWSLPTFWGLCFTDAPHTSALKETEL